MSGCMWFFCFSLMGRFRLVADIHLMRDFDEYL
jgi:hypothetical protein